MVEKKFNGLGVIFVVIAGIVVGSSWTTLYNKSGRSTPIKQVNTQDNHLKGVSPSADLRLHTDQARVISKYYDKKTSNYTFDLYFLKSENMKVESVSKDLYYAVNVNDSVFVLSYLDASINPSPVVATKVVKGYKDSNM